jgi:hypothetical protein
MPDDARHPDEPARRFTVRDAMILVAAAALGFFGYRVNSASLTEAGIGPFGLFGTLRVWELIYGPGLAALAVAMVILRLVSPRPGRADLFRRMGVVGSCVALALTARCFLDLEIGNRLVGFYEWRMFEWRPAIQEGAVGIVLTWSALALAGCLRVGRGWIDRASAALAVLWVLAGAASRIVLLFLDSWLGWAA